MSKRRVAAVALAALLIGGGAGLFAFWSSAESPADSTQAARVGTPGPGAASDGAESPAADALDAAMRPGAGAPRTRARSSPAARAGTDGAAADVATALPAPRGAAEWVDRLLASGVEAAGTPLAVDQYGDADLARIVGFVLDRTLPLDVAPGATLTPLVSRYLERTPGHPLPRDGVRVFVSQDRTGLGWLLAAHVPAEDRLAWLACLMGSGPPWPDAPAAMRDDGVKKLFPVVFRDDRAAASKLVVEAIASADAERAVRAIAAAGRESEWFADLLMQTAREHPEPRVRVAAMSAIVASFDPACRVPVFADFVVAQAIGGGGDERLTAIDALGAAGPAGRSAAAKLIGQGADEVVAERAINSLVRSGFAGDCLDLIAGGSKATAFVVALRRASREREESSPPVNFSKQIREPGDRVPMRPALQAGIDASIETVRRRAAEVPLPDAAGVSAWAELMVSVGRTDLVVDRLRSPSTLRDTRVALLAPDGLPHAEVDRAAESVLLDSAATDEELLEVIERLAALGDEVQFGSGAQSESARSVAAAGRAAMLRRFVAASGVTPADGDTAARRSIARAAEKLAIRLEAASSED